MDLHIFFLPFLAPGHMIPMVDLARLFASHGIRATIITTTANIPLVQPTVDLASADTSLRHPIQLLPLHLPCSEAGLPEGYENLTAFPDPDILWKFTSATDKLEVPFSKLLQAHRPDCIVADMFYPWASYLANEFGIPRLLFHGSSFFSSTISGVLAQLKLDEKEQAFDLPGLPHRIRLTLSQIPDCVRHPNEFVVRVADSFRESHGMIMNSFYELERDYIDHAPKSTDMKFWFVGPVSLYNRQVQEKMLRGDTASVTSEECLKWLDSNKPMSVLYACFGSLTRFSTTQLHEIALALEASTKPFIWVVRHAGEPWEWLPEGFEKRVTGQGKGIIMQGWAPQLLLLNHEAVGGFMTHCGWNSCLEGMSAGVPMITWPQFAEQHLNEKLLVNVLNVGIAIGATVCHEKAEERTLVKGEQIKKAVDELMGNGKEAEERRKRTREIGEMARKAMDVGGSSYVDMNLLIEHLITLKTVRLGKMM